jgi:NAD-dependent deacetylase
MGGDPEESIAQAAQVLAAGGCVALTGAGISVHSGIPDFRSKDGLWQKFDPMEYATAHAWRSSPDKVWELFRATGSMMMQSKPNEAHAALARLEGKGLIDAVVTQNIDGLHQAAGSRRVVEFHGNAVDIYCESCGRTVDRNEALGFLDIESAPSCSECSGLVRPSVVLFGEPIPQDALQEAARLAAGCRSMLVVGTSAVVAPASLLPLEAGAHGAAVIEVNPETTELTSRADIVLRGRAEEILPLVEEMIIRQA